jgi:DHA1 family multidrug resistance protein-like MFS transporter
MVADIIRESPFGQIVRFLSRGRLFQYPEEKGDFTCPTCYTGEPAPTNNNFAPEEKEDASSDTPADPVEPASATESHDHDLEKIETAKSDSISSSSDRSPTAGLQRTHTLAFTAERFQVEQALAAERTKSRPILATKTSDGTILADWYTTDDPANPQNWSQAKKFLVALQIDLYTFVVYAGSSIYVSSELLVMAKFGVAEFKGSLGLAFYVLGYGLGPLIFSPMSEIPAFGRNVPYIGTVFRTTPKLVLPLV